jgi:hypothetical protein
VSAVVVLALLPAIVFGWGTNLEYLHASSARLLHIFGLPAPAYGLFNPHPLAWERSRSILSGLARITAAAGLPPATPFVATPVILLVLLALIAWIYRQHGRSLLKRFTVSPAVGIHTTRLFVLDWTLFVATLLAFSPQLPKRFLIALLPAVLLASLKIIQPTTTRRHRMLLGGSLAAIFAGCLLPTSSTLAFDSPAAIWNSAGTVGLLGWCLPALALVLLYTCMPEPDRDDSGDFLPKLP